MWGFLPGYQYRTQLQVCFSFGKNRPGEWKNVEEQREKMWGFIKFKSLFLQVKNYSVNASILLCSDFKPFLFRRNIGAQKLQVTITH